jgi:hypothetical protein
VQRFASVWLPISLVIILLQFVYSNRPRISIEPDVNVHEADPASTLFRIVNIGPLYLNDVTVGCIITTSSITRLEVMSNTVLDEQGDAATGSQPIARLVGGRGVTRDCGATSHAVTIPPFDPSSLRLDIVVSYKLPLIPITRGFTPQLAVRRIAKGKTNMVPYE